MLSGIALEQRDLSTAERLTEQALSISERRRPAFEFLALLDRAVIWAARSAAIEDGDPSTPTTMRLSSRSSLLIIITSADLAT